ncbi:MAG: zf-TFIIB domain-containing protein [Deltaproteobacteria bacterium]|nr:zf-TFIIB domain-containing protein [Deltaproteobacteria bacterium]
MASKKTTSSEEEYFAREEAEKLRKLKAQTSKQLTETQRVALKELHYMKCPKCGMDLKTVVHRGVEIDRCENCGGVWLDRGELEELTEDDGILRSMVNLFRKG